MKLLMNANEFIFQKKVMQYLICTGLTLLFHKPLEQLFTMTVVKYGLSSIVSVWYNDLIFFAIIIFTVIYVTQRFKNYVPSLNIVVLLIGLSIFYFAYRNISDVWVFTSFLFNNKVKYADTLFFVTFCNCILLVKNKAVNFKMKKDGFFDDEPIGIEKVDELGYTTYANLLSDKISNSYFTKSFAIGINGKWGTGKTSFIDLLKRNLNDKDLIEINFNPWNSHSSNAIIQDFFDNLQESIRPYHSTLARLMISYSNKLLSLNDNTVTQTIQTTIGALTGFDSLDRLYNDINSALKSINKQIVMYIDDLDRLDKDEIVEVIQLIRNTANFHNTVFIVGYDRSYIVNALRNHNSYGHYQFLDKIFQIEITLPYYKKTILKSKLTEKLKFGLPEEYHKEIEKFLVDSSTSSIGFLNDWLESIRDVTRLSNSIVLNLKLLIGEVDFSDFLMLELLRIKYPSVYELIFKKTQLFFENSNESSKKSYYKLKKIEVGEKRDTQFDFDKTCRTELEYYLYRYCNLLLIPEDEINKIHNFIDSIFMGGSFHRINNRTHLSVIYPSKFYNYFTYNLLEGSLSEVAFSKARDLSQVEFNSKIDGWISKKMEYEVIERFTEINSFDNKEDFEKVTRAIFYLANTKSINQNFHFGNLIRYDNQDLFNKISRYETSLLRSEDGENSANEGLRNFILGLFDDATPPFKFEADFISFLKQRYNDDFPVRKDELHNIIVSYFRVYCELSLKLDNYIWSLFNDTNLTVWDSTGNGTIQRRDSRSIEGKNIFKNFILKKDLNGFLLWSINVENIEQNKFSINNFVIDIFDSWSTFKEILKEQDEYKWSYLEEFGNFLSEFGKKDYIESVEFKFVVIPINEILKRN